MNTLVLPVSQLRSDLVANGSPAALAIVAQIDAVMSGGPPFDPSMTTQEIFGAFTEANQARGVALGEVERDIRDFFVA
jgi:hypothetical protein